MIQKFRQQILRARDFTRDSLLDREYTREEQNKITLIMTYYQVFQNIKKTSAELHRLIST